MDPPPSRGFTRDGLSAQQAKASRAFFFMKSDDENLLFADDLGKVDALNAKFYGDFPYPWPPMVFESVADASLFRQMLAQDVGDWSNEFLPGKGMRIWVAGCGTNQAVFTALKFPSATVVGSDLSAPSLELAERSAKNLGLHRIAMLNRRLRTCGSSRLSIAIRWSL